MPPAVVRVLDLYRSFSLIPGLYNPFFPLQFVLTCCTWKWKSGIFQHKLKSKKNGVSLGTRLCSFMLRLGIIIEVMVYNPAFHSYSMHILCCYITVHDSLHAFSTLLGVTVYMHAFEYTVSSGQSTCLQCINTGRLAPSLLTVESTVSSDSLPALTRHRRAYGYSTDHPV